FDPVRSVGLPVAFNGHEVGRDGGGVRVARPRDTARTMVGGIDSDRLYPLARQAEIADAVPGAGDVRVVTSPYGHDAFLIEVDQIAKLLTELLTP
ncbi:homoserine O-acetyltransferase, partial [Saccharothrix sp. MB29]|nr:homoserine O-acetyltransferase [Saccharothrix sp. MB29]